jgi:hypothetical protein
MKLGRTLMAIACASPHRRSIGPEPVDPSIGYARMAKVRRSKSPVARQPAYSPLVATGQDLGGRPKASYEFWRNHLRPLGFYLKAEVLEYPWGSTRRHRLFS